MIVPSRRLFLPSPGWGHTSLLISQGFHGVMATYYGSYSLSDALISKVDDTIQQQHHNINPSGTQSIRWSGFISPSVAQIYTMQTALADLDQRVKLWLDNRLLVDQWTSLAATDIHATIAFGTALGYFRILMEYQHSVGPMGATLRWKSRAQGMTTVPVGSLFLRPQKLAPAASTKGSTRFSFAGRPR